LSEDFIRVLLSEERRKFEDPEEFLPELLRGGEIIADVGCGPGYYAQTLVKFASKLYCVHVNPRMLQELRKRVKDPKVVTSESTSSIPDSSVDVVILANSFHDMDREKARAEVERILKPKGKVIVVDWKKEDTPIGPPLLKRMSEEDYVRELKGFRLILKFPVGPYHYGLLFQKED